MENGLCDPEQLVDMVNRLARQDNKIRTQHISIKAKSDPRYKKSEEYFIEVKFNFKLDGFDVNYVIEKDHRTMPGCEHLTMERIKLKKRKHKISFEKGENGFHSVNINEILYFINSDYEDRIKAGKIVERSYQLIQNYLQKERPGIMRVLSQRPAPRDMGLDKLLGEIESIRN